MAPTHRGIQRRRSVKSAEPDSDIAHPRNVRPSIVSPIRRLRRTIRALAKIGRLNTRQAAKTQTALSHLVQHVQRVALDLERARIAIALHIEADHQPRGRPHKQGGEWRHSGPLSRAVGKLLRGRDRDAVADGATALQQQKRLQRFAESLLSRKLTSAESSRLKQLAHDGKRSQIVRTLQSWRFDLSDVAVRQLQREKTLLELRRR